VDGVVHPNVEQAIGRDRIRKALKRYENRPADEHRYGIVRSVNEDGSYEVLLDGDVQTSRCAQYGTALVGDRVLAVTKKDGRNDLIGRLGGEIGGGGTVVTKVDDVSNYVAGRVFAHAGTNDPAGALLCDGRAVSRREYWELFDAIGTTYGAGDGSTTFNLPNIESRTIIGESNSYTLGATGGEETHKLTALEMPDHTHRINLGSGEINDYLGGSGAAYGIQVEGDGSTLYGRVSGGIVGAGGDQPHNNMQPYIVMRYFITTGKGDPVSGINPADYVVEWGNTDGWRWEKWASGKAECWKRVEHAITSWSPWGSAYEGLPSLDQQVLPFEFAEPPVVTPNANSSYGILSVETSRKTTTILTPVFTVTRPNVGGTDPVTIDIHVKGKWKDSPASGGTETIAPTIAERFAELEARLAEAEYDTGWENIYYVADKIIIKARRVGKQVTVSGRAYNGYLPAPSKSWSAVTTLPAKYRPSYIVYAALGSDKDNHVGMADVEPNGLVYVISAGSAINSWGFSVSYPVD
jgi:microcystin-dependent protein